MTASDLIALARAHHINVVFADLGRYEGHELRSEFDPSEPMIRINARLVDVMKPEQADRFIAQAIAHELFHYLEHRGEIRAAQNRKLRERLADRFARTFIASST